MPTFARFVLVVIIAAVVGSLGLVVLVNYRASQTMREKNSAAMVVARNQFDKLDRHFRRLDITAAAQRISGEHKVLQTTVAWQEWGFTADSPDPTPLAVHTFVISGDAVVVHAKALQFLDNFTLPAEFKQDNSLFVGRTFMFFTTLAGDAASDPVATVTPAGSEPPPCLLGGSAASTFERRLWQSVWGLTRTTPRAESYGLMVTNYPPLEVPVRLGTVEQVWIQDQDALIVRANQDAGAVRAMLDTLRTQQAKAAAAAAPVE